MELNMEDLKFDSNFLTEDDIKWIVFPFMLKNTIKESDVNNILFEAEKNIKNKKSIKSMKFKVLKKPELLEGKIIRTRQTHNIMIVFENGFVRAKPLNKNFEQHMIKNYYKNECGVSDTVFFSCVNKLKIGDNIEYLDQLIFDKKYKPHKLETKASTNIIIGNPKITFVKKPENMVPNTFDYIHMDLLLNPSVNMNTKEKWIMSNQNEIKCFLLDYLSNNKRYQKYDIPIGFLKLSKITFSKTSNLIRAVFDLKV